MEKVIELERQGFRFAPRRKNGIDRFDYIPPKILTHEQAEALIRLKQDEETVCGFLVGRAKKELNKCKHIAEGGE